MGKWIFRLAIVLGTGALALALVLTSPFPLLKSLGPAICPSAAFYVETEAPAIALTIDDGPSVNPQTTTGILNLLAAYGAHASFFPITDHLSPENSLLPRMVAEGHELGNHLSTDRPAIALGPEAFVRDLERAAKTLMAAANLKTLHWLRPGSGFCSRTQAEAARQRGYQLALGSIWPLDTLPIPPTVSARWILAGLHPGAIVVLHDRGPADARGKRTAQTLALLLPELEARGYRVVTLSELVALGERQPAADDAWPQWADRLRGRLSFGLIIRKFTREQYRTLAFGLGLTNVVLVAIATASGLFRARWLPRSEPNWGKLLGISVRIAIFPALFEELLFRGLFLPAAVERDGMLDSAQIAALVAGLSLYTLSHIPSGYITDRINRGTTGFYSTFIRLDFLGCTLLLGSACTWSYLYCGSLWPAIVEHWLVVWIWFFLGGGYQRLFPKQEIPEST